MCGFRTRFARPLATLSQPANELQATDAPYFFHTSTSTHRRGGVTARRIAPLRTSEPKYYSFYFFIFHPLTLQSLGARPVWGSFRPLIEEVLYCTVGSRVSVWLANPTISDWLSSAHHFTPMTFRSWGCCACLSQHPAPCLCGILHPSAKLVSPLSPVRLHRVHPLCCSFA